jgi:hypothetical protein
MFISSLTEKPSFNMIPRAATSQLWVKFMLPCVYDPIWLNRRIWLLVVWTHMPDLHLKSGS